MEMKQKPPSQMPVAFPPALREKLDTEAAERRCSRASIVVAALEQRYGGNAELRPTSEAHRDAIRRLAECGPFTTAKAAEAAGVSYSMARIRVLQLVDSGDIVETLIPGTGTQKHFIAATQAQK